MSKEILALFINVISGFLVIFIMKTYTWLSKKFKIKNWIAVLLAVVVIGISSLLIFQLVSGFPNAAALFSNFEKGQPINTADCHWGIFDDSPYNGNSKVSIQALRRDEHEKPYTENDHYYAEISYLIGSSNRIEVPYCGVSSWFSDQFEPRSLSDYSIICIDAWHEGPTPPETRFFLQIVPARIYRGFTGFYRYDFMDSIKTTSTTINIPFTDLKRYPALDDQNISFNTASIRDEVLSIAVVIEGKRGIISQGRLSFDNVRFK